MWISETDQEVKVFHPVCKKALEDALSMIGLEASYAVEHHRYVGGLEMDLVISNKLSKKILCVVEVKRTIPAVYSTRYQYQAMSYVQSLRNSEKETDYYILTNLECSCLFKYSSTLPNVYDQLLKPGITILHRFQDVSESEFRHDLACQYSEYLKKIINGDTDYVLSFSQFAASVKTCMPNLLKWNTSLAYLFYEYIRGSFKTWGREGFYNIRRYNNDIYSICQAALRVNFKGIFGLPQDEYTNQYIPDNTLMVELFKLGQNFKDAEAICNVMHQVISAGHTHEGEVPTDIELAQVLSYLVYLHYPNLNNRVQICDPTAGSGTLLSAMVSRYNNIAPSQIKANDINKKLLQLLTLRLGLDFASLVNKNSSPDITACNITNLKKDYFKDVKVVVMNPPYLSAVSDHCIERKQDLAYRISQITNSPSITNIGQAALECLFVELVTDIVEENTLIACILPNTHLTALGDAEVVFRRFLVEHFGLSMIFTYPQTNLFRDVIQNTSIYIGFARKRQQQVKILQSLSLISEIEESSIANLVQNMTGDNTIEDPNGEISGFVLDSNLLLNKAEDGWTLIDPLKAETQLFFTRKILSSNIFKLFAENLNGGFYRGKVGNNGGSDLLYISSNEKFYNQIHPLIHKYIKAGLRNSDYSFFIVGDGDQYFLDVSLMSDLEIKKIVKIYKKDFEKTSSKQKKSSKSVDDYINILKRESKYFVKANTVILPRASRKYASVYITNHKTYLSTNFFAIETESKENAKILGTWMSSIYFQLYLETICKNQGGMRKIEAENIIRTYIPNIDLLSKEDKKSLINAQITEFFDLREPKIRDIDKLWANIIAPDNADTLMEEALILLKMLSATREY